MISEQNSIIEGVTLTPDTFSLVLLSSCCPSHWYFFLKFWFLPVSCIVYNLVAWPIQNPLSLILIVVVVADHKSQEVLHLKRRGNIKILEVGYGYDQPIWWLWHHNCQCRQHYKYSILVCLNVEYNSIYCWFHVFCPVNPPPPTHPSSPPQTFTHTHQWSHQWTSLTCTWKIILQKQMMGTSMEYPAWQ